MKDKVDPIIEKATEKCTENCFVERTMVKRRRSTIRFHGIDDFITRREIRDRVTVVFDDNGDLRDIIHDQRRHTTPLGFTGLLGGVARRHMDDCKRLEAKWREKTGR